MNCYKLHNTFLLLVLSTTISLGQQIDFVVFTSDSLIHASNGSSLLRLTFEVDSGLHIQSNLPTDASLIPTEIKIELPGGITAGDPIFPPTKQVALEGYDELLEVYTGQVEIMIPINYQRPQTPGLYQTSGYLSYQACDDKRCFYPRVLRFGNEQPR